MKNATIQFTNTPDNLIKIQKFMGSTTLRVSYASDPVLFLPDGKTVGVGEWIVKDKSGALTPAPLEINEL